MSDVLTLLSMHRLPHVAKPIFLRKHVLRKRKSTTNGNPIGRAIDVSLISQSAFVHALTKTTPTLQRSKRCSQRHPACRLYPIVSDGYATLYTASDMMSIDHGGTPATRWLTRRRPSPKFYIARQANMIQGTSFISYESTTTPKYP
jgi:hypothetical protein